jgi:hypothetical protein
MQTLLRQRRPVVVAITQTGTVHNVERWFAPHATSSAMQRLSVIRIVPMSYRRQQVAMPMCGARQHECDMNSLWQIDEVVVKKIAGSRMLFRE